MLPVGNAMFGQRQKPPPGPATSGASQIGDLLTSLTNKASETTGLDTSGIWHMLQGSVGFVHVFLGLLMTFWSLWAMAGLNAQVDALLLGVLTSVAGAVGVLGWHKNAASAKTTYLAGVCVIAMMALSFRSRLTHNAENDCIMAETWVRMDHLEKAVMDVKHEDLLNSVMVRLDHMHQSLEEAEVGAADAASHRQEQMKFQSMDRQFIDEKLHALHSMAAASYDHLDERIAEITANMTQVQDAQTLPDAPQSQRIQLAQKLKSLRALGNFIGRQQTQIADLQTSIEAHATSDEPISAAEFERLLTALGKQNSHEDLAKDLQYEKDNVGFVTAALGRVADDKYHEISIGGFADRDKARVDRREQKKLEFEKHVSGVLENHNNTFESPETFVKSLNTFLKDLPENCLREMHELKPGLYMTWAIILFCGIGAHAALTSVVVSSKKDT